MFIFRLLSRAIITFLVVLAYTQFAKAQDYQLGRATIEGSGCPASSAAVSISADQKTISVLFDKFSVQKKAGFIGMDVATCNIRIEVNNITEGYVLDTTTFDIRGFAELPDGSVATLITRGGAEGAGDDNRVAQDISSSGDFNISRVAVQANINHCHAKPNDQIKLGMMIRLRSNKQTQSDSMITIDTADLGSYSGLEVGVRLKKCDEGNGENGNSHGNGNGNDHGNGNGGGHGNGHGNGNGNGNMNDHGNGHGKNH